MHIRLQNEFSLEVPILAYSNHLNPSSELRWQVCPQDFAKKLELSQ